MLYCLQFGVLARVKWAFLGLILGSRSTSKARLAANLPRSIQANTIQHDPTDNLGEET